jgi:hypothetical protein
MFIGLAGGPGSQVYMLFNFIKLGLKFFFLPQNLFFNSFLTQNSYKTH